MFRAQSWKPLPARYPLFIHRTIEELVLQGCKSNTWAGGKTRKLRCFSSVRAVPHRRNATSALDSARDSNSSSSSRSASLSPSVRVRSDPNGSAPKMGSFKCEHVSGEAVVGVAAVKAGGERGVRCSRGVGLMSELCLSAAGIYTRAIRWEMEMEVLNFIHQKSPGNNIGREWFIDAVIRLSVSFFFHVHGDRHVSEV